MEKHKKSKKTIISIGVFSLGIATLAGGAGFFIYDMLKKPDIRDAEFITSKGEWTMLYLDTSLITNCSNSVEKIENEAETNCTDSTPVEPEPSSVIWNFTEIGKGSLTTNNHIDDHDFRWELSGNKIKIETDWLYTLYGEYDYKLDQEKSLLTITDSDGNSYEFTANKE